MKRRIDFKSVCVASIIGLCTGVYIFNPIVNNMKENIDNKPFYTIQCFKILSLNNLNIIHSNYLGCKRKGLHFFYNTYKDPGLMKRNIFVFGKYNNILKSIKHKSERKIKCAKDFLSNNNGLCSNKQPNELYDVGRKEIKDKKRMKGRNIDTNNHLLNCEKSIALLNTLYNIIQEKGNNHHCDDTYYVDEKNKLYNQHNDKDLCNNIIDVIKNEKNIKTTFLILHTVNKIMCINKYIPYIYEDILLIEDMEILSIILRVLTNSFYDDKKLLFILMNKLKESIILGTSSNLTISNTFFCYSNLYTRGIINKNDIPLEHILGIVINYYDTFSSVQLVEILGNFEYYDFMKEKRCELVKEKDDLIEMGNDHPRDNNNNNDDNNNNNNDNNNNDDNNNNNGGDIKRLKKLRAKLFLKVANHFIQQNIIKELSTKEKIDLIYAFSKNRIYHEKIFLSVFEYLLKIIKGYNRDIINNKFSYLFEKRIKDEHMKKGNGYNRRNENDNIDNTNLKNEEIDKKDISRFINKEVLNDAIKNISNILYSYSKFNIYIDELYNEILLFLQYFYKYMDCSILSKCLISLTKVNCNINILLCKIYKEKLDDKINVKNDDHFLAHCSSIHLMNYLLSYSRNLFLEKGVYNIISYYLLKNDKINSLNSLDLINIFHAYSKIYYIDKKLFQKIDHILLQRLEANKDYLTIDLAIKYINAVSKLSYKNVNIIYKIIEIIYQTNHLHNIKIIHLFKLLKNIKKLNISYEILQKHIQMIAPNITLDFANYQNYYYKAKKEIHVRKKKWIW
ncbi:hypothetical protein PFUGPA_02891 [Plasmodium falciparum Palo Alto/Uganda]|uniref:Uncharacterized protein n=5 Tax=Plasmodium falciparum TaxID=5833 RepID=W4IZ32_PLAFP|nr:hypothetical protein PFFVO_02423 [Plasmodium falciparum Vietnam Oak-Knoll (FVO)]ETW43068.1 hypothetical protein PFNF135_02543 [Plasmodium falciparum NF135/5.C10]ETW49489.1 hypothetical protein PFMALIP_02417 [Plasmodium falciparum MaliPS096_E11]ETW55069.1 hypothetical protein PFUGPA_02891 [Plasmodium falciparum Palo Alto/Uganda]ETW61731.1 hypothetical protein PFMC_02383 [Plasmodium falciparum CAMP/Malaysia]